MSKTKFDPNTPEGQLAVARADVAQAQTKVTAIDDRLKVLTREAMKIKNGGLDLTSLHPGNAAAMAQRGHPSMRQQVEAEEARYHEFTKREIAPVQIELRAAQDELRYARETVEDLQQQYRENHAESLMQDAQKSLNTVRADMATASTLLAQRQAEHTTAVATIKDRAEAIADNEKAQAMSLADGVERELEAVPEEPQVAPHVIEQSINLIKAQVKSLTSQEQTLLAQLRDLKRVQERKLASALADDLIKLADERKAKMSDVMRELSSRSRSWA